MEVTPEPEEDARLPQLLMAGWSRRIPDRKLGFHVSGLISDIMVTSGMFRSNSGDLLDAMAILRITMGYVWEDIVGDYLSAIASPVNQLPMYVDGIHGTPDGVSGLLLEEYKATWMSEERALSGNSWWRWYTQIQAYCYMTGILGCRLRILHMCPFPRSRTYKIIFTPQEVNETWQMLCQHKAFLSSKGLVPA